MQPFPDHGFKLVVLQELLETGSFTPALEALKARPDIAARLSGEVGYGERIPELDAFFREVALTADDLDRVTTLCFDGGNDIYHLIRPFWSGESDEFDVRSVDGFEALRQLRSVLHCSMIGDDQIARLAAAGITIE